MKHRGDETMKVHIRLAKASDYDEIMEILNQVHALHVKLRPDLYQESHDLFTLEELKDDISHQGYYVAKEDGKVVGILRLMFRHIKTPAHQECRIIWIDTMGVADGYRGKGIGHQLLCYVKTLKEQLGYDRIELQVNAQNQHAYDIYKQYGFVDKSIIMELS